MTVPDCRRSLVAGGLIVPVELGLSGRVAHLERAERECFVAALGDISNLIGPAARMIDCGPFAGALAAQILNGLERPKAGIIMTTNLDTRQFARLLTIDTTAEVTHVLHQAHKPEWPLEVVGAGTTLVVMCGGGYGLSTPLNAFAALENASHRLGHGDFVALSLEIVRDGATLDAAYRDFGTHLIVQALTSLGRAEGLEPRTFYHPATNAVRFGALAKENASLAWNGTICEFDAGSWIDMGAMQLHEADARLDLHPDFEIAQQWPSQDGAVALLLLRKI